MQRCSAEEADVVIDGVPYRLASGHELRQLEKRLAGLRGGYSIVYRRTKNEGDDTRARTEGDEFANEAEGDSGNEEVF